MPRRRRTAFVLAAALATPLPPHAALAAGVSHYYVGPTNSLFSSPANWSLSPNGPGGSPPAASDNAIVAPGSPLSLTVDSAPGGVTLATLSLSGSPSSPLSITHTGSLVASTALLGPYTSYTATGSAYVQFYPVIDGAGASFSANSPSVNLQFHQGALVGPSAGGSFSISAGYAFLEHPLAFGGTAGTATGTIAGGTLSGAVRLDSAGFATVTQTDGQVSAVYPVRNGSYALTGGAVGSVSFAVKDTFNPPISVPVDNGATFTQTGGTVAGTVNVNPYSAGVPALYSLSGTGVLSSATSNPTLTVASAYAATFAQSGGTVGGGAAAAPPATNSSTGAFVGDPSVVYLGRTSTAGTASTGTYSLSSAGQLFTDKLYVGHGDHGTFAQSGGALTLRGAAPTLSLGTNANATGSYSISAGSLSFNSTSGIPGFLVGDAGSGAFTHSGGSVSLPATCDLRLGNAPASAGTYSLSGSASLSATTLTVAYSGVGTFAQSGGASTFAPSYVHLGYNPGASGTYSLSAGALSATTLEAGYSGTGTLAISGGLASVSTLWLGYLNNSTGSLALTGGTLAASAATFGTSGAATVNQSAGSLTVSGTLTLASAFSASSTYSLTGTGSLRAGRLVVGADPSGRASFAQTGGAASFTSLQIPSAGPGIPHAYSLSAGTLSVSSATTVNGTLTQSGGVATLSSVTGTGSVSLSGTASLTATSVRVRSLSLAGSAAASLRPTATPSTLSTLTLSDTSTFDLGSNTLQITSNAATTVPTIRQYLHDARLVSSTVSPTQRLAYALDSAGTTLAIHPALTGDANLDGQLNADDYALLDRSLAVSRTNAFWSDGDFTYDGVVDQNDYLLIDTAYFKAQGSFPGSLLSQRDAQFGPDYVSTLLAAVPEPSLLSSILYPLSSLLLTPRRRRR